MSRIRWRQSYNRRGLSQATAQRSWQLMLRKRSQGGRWYCSSGAWGMDYAALAVRACVVSYACSARWTMASCRFSLSHPQLQDNEEADQSEFRLAIYGCNPRVTTASDRGIVEHLSFPPTLQDSLNVCCATIQGRAISLQSSSLKVSRSVCLPKVEPRSARRSDVWLSCL